MSGGVEEKEELREGGGERRNEGEGCGWEGGKEGR